MKTTGKKKWNKGCITLKKEIKDRNEGRIAENNYE
jgi:hypothetical protein